MAYMVFEKVGKDNEWYLKIINKEKSNVIFSLTCFSSGNYIIDIEGKSFISSFLNLERDLELLGIAVNICINYMKLNYKVPKEIIEEYMSVLKIAYREINCKSEEIYLSDITSYNQKYLGTLYVKDYLKDCYIIEKDNSLFVNSMLFYKVGKMTYRLVIDKDIAERLDSLYSMIPYLSNNELASSIGYFLDGIVYTFIKCVH